MEIPRSKEEMHQDLVGTMQPTGRTDDPPAYTEQVITGQPMYAGQAGAYAGQLYNMDAVPYTNSSTQWQGQHTGTVVVTHTAEEVKQDMTGAIVLSCVVVWCCNILFGCIAFIVAMAGQSAVTKQQSKQYYWGSIGVSIAGVVISIILLVVIFTVGFGTTEDPYHNYYNGYN